MKTAFFISFFYFSCFAFSHNAMDSCMNCPKLKLDLTIIDLPYQIDAIKTVGDGKVNTGNFFRGYANPSMYQSLSLSTDLYSSAHFYIDKHLKVEENYFRSKRSFLHVSSLLLIDYIFAFAPLGDGWLHEEYHRAIMTRFHVNSYNNMNNFPLGEDLVSVDNVIDTDLVRFKLESPHDFNRMHVAGIESGYLLIDKLQTNNFFYEQGTTHEFLYWWITLSALEYVNSSSNPDAVDEDTDLGNLEETTIEERDFTGWDFTAWAYDIFNPNEPYENRGIHPTGVGLDRYIKTTDLSDDALNYLIKQGKLQYLNLLSPMLFFQKSFRLKNDIQFNFSVRNYLNSFGNDISFHLFLKKGDRKIAFAYHQANNYTSTFPAVEFELYEHPFFIKKQEFLITPKLLIGMQPKGQDFFTKKADFLGAFGIKMEWRKNKLINPWVAVFGKTSGWIAGNEFLNSNLSTKFGLSFRF